MGQQARPNLIAGGGIGGLAASIALAQTGLETTVLERSAFTEESGAGIQLSPNATRALRSLGVLDAIASTAFTPEAVWLFDGISGRRLAAVPLGEHPQKRYGAPYLTLHRADLHAGLRAVCETLPHIALKPGFEVAQVGLQGQTVAVTGTSGVKAEGSSLIGADGLWSVVRKTAAPDAQLRFSGATAYRAQLPIADLPSPFGAPVVGLWLGPRAHLVHYPIRAGETLNVVAVTEGGEAAQGWNQAGNPATLLSGFTRWCKESKSLLERAEAWRCWSLFSLAPLPAWSRGPLTLLGDSAHPVLPYLAQGAALAIEDAVALASCLAGAPDDPADAFQRYESMRQPRALRVQRVSRRFGRLYHLSGPARLARNFALSCRSQEAALRQFDWLHGSEV